MATGAQCGQGAEAAAARLRVAAAAAQDSRASHRYVPSRIGHVLTIRSSTVNLSSQTSYRQGGRGPLPMDLVVTPPIKALRVG
jgi:hypothetical protein